MHLCIFSGDQNSLSILDIPGFECFAQENTLDQFLVNMTNEQMQFFYNQRVFIWEMVIFGSSNESTFLKLKDICHQFAQKWF